MKIIYIANARLPTEKAHGIQIMKTCEAFARLGHELELIVPFRRNAIPGNPFSYYGVEPLFKIRVLPSIDLVRFGKIGFLIQSFSFAVAVAWYTLFHPGRVLYSRDEVPLYLLSFLGKSFFWEAHNGRDNRVIRRVANRCQGLVVISRGIQDYFETIGIDSKKILVAHDAVDTKIFSKKIPMADARAHLSIPPESKVALYTGSISLYAWKGVDIFLESARLLPHVTFVVVGGKEGEVLELKKKFPIFNVRFEGQKSQKDIPWYLQAADVLVIPNKKGDIVSEKYTSPLKLFEYMASGRPIVASDLPSIREVVNEKSSIFFAPNDPKDLADKIQTVLDNPSIASKIGEQSMLDSAHHTWEGRAKNIIDFVVSFSR